MNRTTRVRIAVCVQSDGAWSAAGWNDQKDYTAASVAAESFTDELPLRWSWVEADVPVPEPDPEPDVVRGIVLE